MAKYYEDCALCGEPVALSRQSLLKHVRGDTLPLCRKNGCFRYEHLVDAGSAGTARKPKGVAATHVAGRVYDRSRKRGQVMRGRSQTVRGDVAE